MIFDQTSSKISVYEYNHRFVENERGREKKRNNLQMRWITEKINIRHTRAHIEKKTRRNRVHFYCSKKIHRVKSNKWSHSKSGEYGVDVERGDCVRRLFKRSSVDFRYNFGLCSIPKKENHSWEKSSN